MAPLRILVFLMLPFTRKKEDHIIMMLKVWQDYHPGINEDGTLKDPEYQMGRYHARN